MDQETKNKKSKAMIGKSWKLINGKRVYDKKDKLQCNYCKKIEDNYTKFSYKDTKCDTCYLQYNREYMKNNPEQRAKKSKAERKRRNKFTEEQKENNRKKSRLYKRTLRARYKFCLKRAENRKLSFTLSFEDFCDLAVKACYYCSNLLCKISENCSNIDRIDSSKGYDLENVLPCCAQCNRIKSDYLTVEETEAAVKAIIKIRQSK